MFLKNYWYPVALAKQVGDRPLSVTLCGEAIALYRDGSGQIQALSDRCVHRGAALSSGWVENDCLVCPYHGWQYDAQGHCRKIPANTEQQRIPFAAKVLHYDAIERYGLVWLFYGDLPEAERPPLPPLPEYDDPAWRTVQGEVTYTTHYTRVTENLMDFAHAPFTHSGSFGAASDPLIEPYKVEQLPEGLRAQTQFTKSAYRGIWKLFNRSDAPRTVTTTITLYMPCIVRTETDLGNGFRFIGYGANLPIDAETTKTFWLTVRTFFTGAWADGDTVRRSLKIIEEDKRIVETQRPKAIPLDDRSETHVAADALQIGYRNLLRQARDRGWAIADSKMADQELVPAAK
ncbi:aromatic ring-hydroxylating dioxygenase subunit alpha [Synechococcus elongatus IITB4]|uniref:aromatic ring-hydroxylating dioxygenase subunit alpha n=1 Tax=Synechococcus elongatus TaxID=32046 RepID=UPI0030CBB1B0